MSGAPCHSTELRAPCLKHPFQTDIASPCSCFSAGRTRPKPLCLASILPSLLSPASSPPISAAKAARGPGRWAVCKLPDGWAPHAPASTCVLLCLQGPLPTASPVCSLKVQVKLYQSCLTLCNPMDYIVHGIFQARTRVGSLSLLQGIFLTQGSNPGLPHCTWILYQLSPGEVCP